MNVDLLIENAKKILPNSYSPYSSFKVACAIEASNGKIYSGVNVENSSYGLTICAEASAISQMISDGARQIKHLVLLTANDSLCSPCGACRQRIFEFSDSNTKISLYANSMIYKSFTIDELLPCAFKLKEEL